ncbi:ArsR/SmtB family transcription factor [Roseococcus thiosulfatophilus]|uniref:ArsR/SmtB family transcription factor n=1 Tax=Roseococcus thiosulfatophilus TaxID=35813 RepID=UPI001F5D8830|nr:metalloregulator ArsR/SmtB family transcription factor [Roseococcus thiosulfatophilus]
MSPFPMDPASQLETHAQDAASLLRQLANARRLMLLCQLAAEGEVTVGRLAERVGLSQAALSQHLMRLRAEGLVARRREGTHLHYRIADPRVGRLMTALHELFCEAHAPALTH